MQTESLFVKSGSGFIDIFPLIFIAIGLIAVIFAVVAFISSKASKSKCRILIVVAFALTIALYVGALILGLIGLKPHSYTLFQNPYSPYSSKEITYYDRHSCAWVCMGLACGAIACGITALALYLATKTREPEPEEPDCIFYQEFSQGAIAVKKDYIIFFRNWLKFTRFKKGRVSTIIFINDIQHVTYKGSGWPSGILLFTFKHANKPMGIKFSTWWVWRRKKLNTKMAPIYEYLRERVIENNK